MRERYHWINDLKLQLKKSQDRIKKFADGKRSDRKFQVGDWVYLKLQPYRQVTVQKRQNQKLAAKYYGPFEIIAKFGEVAYELRLPDGSQIHPVFHVSQLKGRIGNEQVVSPGVPLSHPQLNLKVKPEGILGRRLVKRKNAAVAQVLVKWENQNEENASWEDYEEITRKFPELILRDKDYLMEEGMSGILQSRLLAVKRIDSVKLISSEGETEGKIGQENLTTELSLTVEPRATGREIKRNGQGMGSVTDSGVMERDVKWLTASTKPLGDKEQ